jgi:hypothetical protein
VKQFLEEARPPRVAIWDTMDEYGAIARRVGTLKELLEVLRTQSAYVVRYVPRGTDRELTLRFDAFCTMCFDIGDLLMVVEELERVTSPSHAPAAWSDCTLRGRHKNLSIMALSQRPASVDKNFFSNATVIRTGRLNYVGDVACMANVLCVDRRRIAALRPLEYIERDMTTGETREGLVTFAGEQKALPRARKTTKFLPGSASKTAP